MTRDSRMRWAFAAMAILMALSVSSANASVGWCRSDPVIVVNGIAADVFVSAPLDAPFQVTGPTEIVISTPKNVDAALIVSTPGFGRGESVTFKRSGSLKAGDDGIELLIEVFVPAADDQMPVEVEFAPRLVGVLAPVASEGAANEWISFRVVL